MRLVQACNRLATRPANRRATPGRSAVPLALLAAGLLAAGCSGAGSPAASAGGQQITVAVVPGVDTAPLQVAVHDGLFGQHGLNVSIRTFSTLRGVYSALASGQVDIAAGDYADFLYRAVNSQSGLRLVADGYDAAPGTMEVLTLPGSRITTPQDLEGQQVATPQPQLARFSSTSPYSIETLATESVLQGDGVSPSSVVWKPMPAASMIAALRTHRVAAIVATEPYILQAETQLGAVELLDSCSGVTAGLPLTGYFSTARFASGNLVALRAFQAALSAAQAEAAQRGTIEPMLVGQHTMSAQDAALITLGQYPTFLSIGQVQRVADLMYNSGMINTTISVKALIAR